MSTKVTRPDNTKDAALELLRLVMNHLDAFEMNEWCRISGNDQEQDGFVLNLENITEGQQKCGTTLCLAGFASLAMGDTVEIRFNDHVDALVGERIAAPGNKYSETYGEPGEEITREYAKSWTMLGAEYLHLEHRLQGELFYTSNGEALAMLVDLARGVPEEVVLSSFNANYYSKFRDMDLYDIAGDYRYL